MDHVTHPPGRIARLFVIVLLVVAAMAVGPAAGQTEALRPVQSRHYEMLSDLDPMDARRVARHMDMMFELYLDRFGHYPIRNGEPLKMWVFARQDDYTAFLASHGIDATNSGGMFFRTDDARGLASWLGDRGTGSMLETLRHEGMHQVAYQRIADGLPTWCNEGMAEFFGYALETARGIEPGIADPWAIARLRDARDKGTLFSLEELLFMSGADWNSRVRSGEAGKTRMYDQAWSVVHFLVNADRGRYQSLLVDYVHACWQGLQPEQAAENIFGRDLGPMQEAWEQYIDELKPDQLILGREQMKVVAQAVQALGEHDRVPQDVGELRALLEELEIELDLPERYADMPEWWWLEPIESKRGRTAELRIKAARSKRAKGPTVELIGLRRRVAVRWTDAEPGYEVVFR